MYSGHNLVLYRKTRPLGGISLSRSHNKELFYQSVNSLYFKRLTFLPQS